MRETILKTTDKDEGLESTLNKPANKKEKAVAKKLSNNEMEDIIAKIYNTDKEISFENLSGEIKKSSAILKEKYGLNSSEIFRQISEYIKKLEDEVKTDLINVESDLNEAEARKGFNDQTGGNKMFNLFRKYKNSIALFLLLTVVAGKVGHAMGTDESSLKKSAKIGWEPDPNKNPNLKDGDDNDGGSVKAPKPGKFIDISTGLSAKDSLNYQVVDTAGNTIDLEQPVETTDTIIGSNSESEIKKYISSTKSELDLKTSFSPNEHKLDSVAEAKMYKEVYDYFKNITKEQLENISGGNLNNLDIVVNAGTDPTGNNNVKLADNRVKSMKEIAEKAYKDVSKVRPDLPKNINVVGKVDLHDNPNDYKPGGKYWAKMVHLTKELTKKYPSETKKEIRTKVLLELFKDFRYNSVSFEAIDSNEIPPPPCFDYYDIVDVIIDNSGSMGDEKDSLYQQTNRVFESGQKAVNETKITFHTLHESGRSKSMNKQEIKSKADLDRYFKSIASASSDNQERQFADAIKVLNDNADKYSDTSMEKKALYIYTDEAFKHTEGQLSNLIKTAEKYGVDIIFKVSGENVRGNKIQKDIPLPKYKEIHDRYILDKGAAKIAAKIVELQNKVSSINLELASKNTNLESLKNNLASQGIFKKITTALFKTKLENTIKSTENRIKFLDKQRISNEREIRELQDLMDKINNPGTPAAEHDKLVNDFLSRNHRVDSDDTYFLNEIDGVFLYQSEPADPNPQKL
jgi:hypothetical protein